MEPLIRRLVIGMLALVLLANAALLAGIVITREPAPRPLNGERILTASRPAIVLVQSNYDVTTSLPKTTIPEGKVQLLTRQIIDQIRSGQVAPNEAAAQQAAINLLVSNPDAYFEPGATESFDFHIFSSGSGFFVSEDGYMVTAAHVVSADKGELRTEVLTLFRKPATLDEGRKQISNAFADATGLSLTSAQVDSLMSFYQRWLEKYLTVDKIDARYFLGTGTVEAGDHLMSTGARASVVKLDPTSSGHDIAIMKADLSGAPTLSLASASPRFGQATHAIGYPRQGYLQEEAQFNATIKPAMTTGTVMSIDAQKGDWSAYATDAQFTEGDSGGPVLDSQGNVIGMISFSKVDSKGKQVEGGGYFVPAQLVQEDLDDISVKVANGPKTLTSVRYHALAEGDIARYKTELVLLGQIQSRSTWDAYVKDDISNAQGQVIAGKDKTPPELADYVPASAASAVLAMLIAVAAWVTVRILTRRRQTALPSAVAASTPQPVQEPSLEGQDGELVKTPIT